MRWQNKCSEAVVWNVKCQTLAHLCHQKSLSHFEIFARVWWVFCAARYRRPPDIVNCDCCPSFGICPQLLSNGACVRRTIVYGRSRCEVHLRLFQCNIMFIDSLRGIDNMRQSRRRERGRWDEGGREKLQANLSNLLFIYDAAASAVVFERHETFRIHG